MIEQTYVSQTPVDIVTSNILAIITWFWEGHGGGLSGIGIANSQMWLDG